MEKRDARESCRIAVSRILRVVVRWLNSSLFFTLVLILSFIFVVWYVYGLCRQGSEYEWHFDYTSLGLSFGLLLLYLFGQILIWRAIVAKLGYRMPTKTAFHLISLATLGAYVPGRIWQATGLFYLTGRESIPKSVTAVSLVLSNALSLSSGAIIFLVSLAWGLNGTTAQTVLWFCVIICLGIALSHPKVIQWALNWLLKLLDRAPVFLPLRWRDIFSFVLMYSGTWVLYGVALAWLVRAMTSLPARAVLGIIGANAASYVLGYIAFVIPAGLGVREAALSGLLLRYMPWQTTVAISLVSRAWMVAGQVLYAGIGLIVRRLEYGPDRPKVS